MVLFDLDETLVQEVAPVLDALRATCEVAGLRRGLDALGLATTLREEARTLWEAAPTHAAARALGISSWEGLRSRFPGDDPTVRWLRRWAPTYRRQVWARALARHGVRDADLARVLADNFPRERAARHAVYDDAEPTLRRLRAAGLRLAVVTNGPSDLQRQKLAASRLGDYFEAVVVSGEVGVGKPDPGIFARALGELRSEPAQALMVGDSLARDVAGGNAAGVRTVWINRRTVSRGQADPLPDQEIHSLHELVPPS